MLPPRGHQGDPRALGPPEVHRGGCTGLGGAGGRLGDASRAAGRRQGATLQSVADPGARSSAGCSPPPSGGRLPSLPAPAQTPTRGTRPQRRQRTARSRQDRTHHPRGPLPSLGRRSPGPPRTLRQAAESAGQSRPLPPRAPLKSGSDSGRRSAMQPPRAAGTLPGAQDAERELYRAGVASPPLEVGRRS